MSGISSSSPVSSDAGFPPSADGQSPQAVSGESSNAALANKAALDLIARACDFILNGPLHSHEIGGFIGTDDLFEGFDRTMGLFMAQHAGQMAAAFLTQGALESAINELRISLIASYAARHRFLQLDAAVASEHRFGMQSAMQFLRTSDQARREQRLCSLCRLRNEPNLNTSLKHRISLATQELFDAMLEGGEKLDHALSILLPLVKGDRISFEDARNLVVHVLESPGTFEFFDAGWFSLVETVARGRASLVPELYWQTYLRRAERYGGCSPELPLLMAATRASDPFWSRAKRACSNTKYYWGVERLRHKLMFNREGRLNPVKVDLRDDAGRGMLRHLEAISDMGMTGNDLAPMSHDEMLRALDRFGRTAFSEKTWTTLCVALSRRIQLSELSAFANRFELDVENDTHALLAGIYLDACATALRGAVVEWVGRRAGIGSERASRVLGGLALDAGELSRAWFASRTSDGAIAFSAFLIGESALGRFAPLPAVQEQSEPAEPPPLPPPSLPSPPPSPEVRQITRADEAAAKRIRSRKNVSALANESAWSGRLSDPSVRKQLLQSHAAALSKLELAPDLRPSSTYEDLASLFETLCAIGGAAHAEGHDESRRFATDIMNLAGVAGCLLIARSIMMDRWPERSPHEAAQQLAEFFPELARRPVFSLLAGAIRSSRSNAMLLDAEALRKENSYDVLGTLGARKRRSMQAALKLKNSETRDVGMISAAAALAAHWNEACMRLQRVPAFDDAMLPAVSLLGDVEEVDRSLRAAGLQGCADLVWKARRTWAVVMLRNRVNMPSMAAVHERMKNLRLVVEEIPNASFRQMMEAKDPGEVSVVDAIRFYAQRAGDSAPAAEDTVSSVEAEDEGTAGGGAASELCSIYDADALELESQPDDGVPSDHVLEGGLAVAGLASRF